MKYDPKLKEAAAEIRAILRKHDLAAYIAMASPTHGEFAMEITPTWSAVKWEDRDNGKLRIRVKEAELGKEKAHALAESTAHMIFQLRDLTALGFKMTDNLAEILKAEIEIEHTSLLILRRIEKGNELEEENVEKQS